MGDKCKHGIDLNLFCGHCHSGGITVDADVRRIPAIVEEIRNSDGYTYISLKTKSSAGKHITKDDPTFAEINW